MASKERRESIKGWRDVACRKSASTLRHAGQTRATALLSHCIASAPASELSAVCGVLRESLPINVRTSLLSEVLSGHTTSTDPDLTVRYVLFSLLSDVTRIQLKCEEVQQSEEGAASEPVRVEEFSDVMEEVEAAGDLSLESLHLDGISLPPGLLSLVLQHSPRLHSLRISGELCSEVLSYLKSHSAPSLHTLTLHTTSSTGVTDEDVVSALVTPHADLSVMGQVLCTSGSLTDFGPVRMPGLRYLSVVTPSASIGGALILLHALRKLSYFHYTWICPVAESLLILRQVSPSSTTPFSLQHLDLSVPSEDTLNYIVSLCPHLHRLEIESVDPDLESLHILSGLPQLSTLHLSMVPEEVVLSALETVGDHLMDLKLEFEACTFHPMSTTTLARIQNNCSHLKNFELLHVNIDVDSGETQASSQAKDKPRAPAFPELERLVLNGSVARPSVLTSLLNQNSSLRSLVLDVNQNAVTDDVIVTLLHRNDMLHLASVFLGAGCISTFPFFCLLSLPSLSSLSLDLRRFPFISEPTFKKLQQDLEDGNYQCVLKNVERED